MFSGLVGLTAIDVSLCGATPSQSVDTLAAIEVGVEQIGFEGFLNCASPGVPSALSTSATNPSQARWVMACGSGLSSARAERLVAPAAIATTAAVSDTTTDSFFIIGPPSIRVAGSAGAPAEPAH